MGRCKGARIVLLAVAGDYLSIKFGTGKLNCQGLNLKKLIFYCTILLVLLPVLSILGCQKPVVLPSLVALSSEEHCDNGIALYTEGKYEQAISEFNIAINIAPYYAKPYNNRGLVYNVMGEYDRALADYNKAIELDPNYIMAYSNRGIFYRSLGKYKMAICDFCKIIELQPKNPSPFYHRGYTHKLMGNRDKAIRDLKKFTNKLHEIQLIKGIDNELASLNQAAVKMLNELEKEQ